MTCASFELLIICLYQISQQVKETKLPVNFLLCSPDDAMLCSNELTLLQVRLQLSIQGEGELGISQMLGVQQVKVLFVDWPDE